MTICQKKLKFFHAYRVDRLQEWLGIRCVDWLIIIPVPFSEKQKAVQLINYNTTYKQVISQD